MMIINMTLTGDPACGKTRATKAIEEALVGTLPDKPYRVIWEHVVAGRPTERGTFDSEGHSTFQQIKE